MEGGLELAVKTQQEMGFRSACLSAAVLLILVAALQGCAPSRTLVLELRSGDTHQPVAHARVRMKFLYALRLQGPPPAFEFETDADGRVVADIVLHEPVFDFWVMTGDQWSCSMVSGADHVEDGRACQWNRMYCLKDGEYQNLTCRFWFAGMPGEPPGTMMPVAPAVVGPIPSTDQAPSN